MTDVWANSVAISTCHIAGCCHLANSMSWSQSYVSHCRVLPPGEFNGMLSQSHVSHCRVLPLGEFTVKIPEPHATLHGVIIPSAMFKIVFAIFYFIFCLFFNAVWALTSGSSDTLVLYAKYTLMNSCYAGYWNPDQTAVDDCSCTIAVIL